jgi:hypothetical protein
MSPANFPPPPKKTHSHYVLDSSTEEEEEKWIPPFPTHIRVQPRVPVIIFTPPTGIDYFQREGRWVFGVPVWDQESAKKALDNLHQLLRDHLYGKNVFSGNMDLEKFFEMADRCAELIKLLTDDSK